MAIIGMDIHRLFAQAAFLQDGQIKREQRVELVHDRLVKFAKTLSVEDEIVIEATGRRELDSAIPAQFPPSRRSRSYALKQLVAREQTNRRTAEATPPR